MYETETCQHRLIRHCKNFHIHQDGNVVLPVGQCDRVGPHVVRAFWSLGLRLWLALVQRALARIPTDYLQSRGRWRESAESHLTSLLPNLQHLFLNLIFGGHAAAFL